jgi:hypothetical protein
MRVYMAPELPLIGRDDKVIFLGGSIEMDTAPKWQNEFIEKLKPLDDTWIVLNPRRTDWDSTWVQSIENPQFFQQVLWEMRGLARADHKVFYFADNTLSPITLLELGKYGGWNAYIVCEAVYKRRGNVEIFCYENDIPIYRDMDEVIKELHKYATQ